MGKISILNSTGHATLVAEPETASGEAGEQQVSHGEAAAIVRRHVAQGGLAYKTGKDTPAEAVRDYDPAAEEIVLAPRMQGGS